MKHVTRYIEKVLPEAEVVLADNPAFERFNRGASRNFGVNVAYIFEPTADVVVLWDADTLCEETPLREAIYGAQQDGKLHLPYTTFRALSRSATQKALRGLPVDTLRAENEHTHATGGVLVLTPSAYREAGEMPELAGWGFEDTIFRICCDAILGPTVKHAGNLTHLWHPTGWSLEDDDYLRNREIAQRYDAAEGNPEAIRKLIEERS